MSTQENGIAANVASNLLAAAAIASSTNTNPIQIATSTPHGLVSGDRVNVADHAVNTSANGIWQASVLTTTTYTIPVAGVGVGGATGTSQSLALGATFAIPSDGDTFAAAAFNVAYEALADRTAFLGSETGAYKLAKNVSAINNDDTGSVWTSAVTATSGVWFTSSSPTIWSVDVVIGDVVDIALNGGIGTSYSTAQEFIFGLMYSLEAPGVAASFSKIPGSGLNPLFRLFGSSTTQSVAHLNGRLTAASTGQLSLTPGFYVGGTPSGGTLNWFGDYTLTIRVWRPTGMPQ